MPARQPAAERFSAIRPWDGRQDRAFEELCFQLREPTPDDAELIKTSAPDAGVEWYWRFGDGTEWGWQVKFVFRTDALLSAMRGSLTAAAAKRRRLRKLTFCIPYDLADDPSRSRGKQARERFEETKLGWKGIAPDIDVELVLGGHLLAELVREQHRGREWFFFGSRSLTREWCETQLEGTFEDAGDRYTPQQNVDLPIANTLEAVALPSELRTRVADGKADVLRAGRRLLSGRTSSDAWTGEIDALREALSRLERQAPTADEPPEVHREDLLAATRSATERIESLRERLSPLVWPVEMPTTDLSDDELKAREARQASARSLWRSVEPLSRATARYQQMILSTQCETAARRCLLLDGPAGQGKTHLVCDVAQRLLRAGHPTIALLGQRFRDSSPWPTLARLLGDPALGPDEVASVLAAAGEAAGRRAVLFIDALNESSDPAMWSAELADLRRRLVATGWVGLAVTCRTSYLDLIEPPGGPDKRFVRATHPGYSGREFEATEHIFQVHGLQPPRVPLLLPEFNTPLFLKLYCEGIKDQPHPPSGGDNLSAVFRRFVAARSARVTRRLALDARSNEVEDAMQQFARALADRGVEELPYDEAKAVIDAFAPHARRSPDTLTEALISEGLLAVDRGWNHDLAKRADFVSFPYQKFSDHLVLGAFLDDRLPNSTPASVAGAFGSNGILGGWLDDAPQGLLEALAVQAPERWGIEIPDLADAQNGSQDPEHFYRHDRVVRAFVESLVLRDRSAFSEHTDRWLNTALSSRPDDVADALLAVAPDPQHPYCGEELHRFLTRFALAERDAFWTKLTFHSLESVGTSLERLIRWAARGPYPEYPDDVMLNAAIPLAWCFASPNRFLRDYVTKAVATLMIGRPALVQAVVGAFAEINDPYVKQRVAASALGATVRTGRRLLTPRTAGHLLAALIRTYIHESTPDVLTRDYVASLARWMHRQRLIDDPALDLALPPYASRPPRVPRSAKHLEETFPEGSRHGEGYGTLHHSALSLHSDWSRYVVSGRVDDFLPNRLDAPSPSPEPTSSTKSLYRLDRRAWRRFIKSLNPEQAASLETLQRSDADAFRAQLSEHQSELLDNSFVLRGPRRRVFHTPMAYPPERAARFIFQRCIELGWRPELFADFDSSVGRLSDYRTSHKSERFGKKYQWIAFHELYARLADNFWMRNWSDKPQRYRGAWAEYLRDFDPTLPPEPIEVGEEQEHVRSATFPPARFPAWWTPPPVTFEDYPLERAGEWAQVASDLPPAERLLRVRDEQGSAWVVTDGYFNWRSESDDIPSVTKGVAPNRDLAIVILGALIRARDLPRLRRWLVSDSDLVRALPHWGNQDVHGAFWSELPQEIGLHDYPMGWAPASGGRREFPFASVPTSIGYSGEAASRDCSLSIGVSSILPSATLRDLTSASWRESSRAWCGPDGAPLARYEETDEGFHRDRVFMVDEAGLAETLRRNDLVAAIGLFCERRVFDREDRSGTPRALGWVDYAGWVVFDGRTWSSRDLSPVAEHESF